jgi:capsular polysaccharide transport system permease protein
MFRTITRHSQITGALVMREIVTRYGREGLGFLWVVGEPLIFCGGVISLWALIKPQYEHGVRVAPFMMTGYMCLLMFRHTVSYSLTAVQANVGLLHHRRVSILHIYISRSIIEFAGSTVAFIVVYFILFSLGLVSLPHDLLLLYSGWMIMAWLSLGVALVFAAITLKFEVMERIVPVVMYLLIPLSGAFIMVAWVPEKYRELYMLLPLPHPIEMVRAAVFGQYVPTYYHVWYPIAWAAGLTVLGLLMLARAKHHLDVE